MSGNAASEGELISAAELSDYKGYPLRDVGRDKDGKVIPHKRDEKVARQIKIWVAGGADINYIAIRLNVRPGLLKQHYPQELILGTEDVHADVHQHLLKRVKESDRMAIFYAKSKMGYRDGESRPNDDGLLNIHIHA